MQPPKLPQLMAAPSKGATAEPGSTQAYRFWDVVNEDLVGPPIGTTNCWELFLRGLKTSGDSPFLGHRDGGEPDGDYVWESYRTVHKRMINFSSGLQRLANLTAESKVGLYSINRPEWNLAEFGCFRMNWVTVPLYDTLGESAVEYILGQTQMPVVVCSKDKIKKLLAAHSSDHALKYIVSMDELDGETQSLVKDATVQIVSFSDVEKKGEEETVADPEEGAKPDDLSTICYTSGTTGTPKGVMLTHGNFLSIVNAVRRASSVDNVFHFEKSDIYLSYLPLAHIMERNVFMCLAYHGARVAYYQGDTLKLLDDVAAIRPTVFVSVPRLFNRIYDKVLAGVKAKGGLAAFLFNKAYSAKKAALHGNGSWNHWLWDRLVFGTVRQRLGGRVKAMLTGSAPITPAVLDFLRIAFSAYVHEGYGQTETCAGISITCYGDTSTGHIGVPLACNEVKLIDVPEMNYFVTDEPEPRGEICARGTNVFKGYFNDPENTNKTLDADGWCHTGDVGAIDSRGRLRIIDRVKNIFKLSQGEYVAPEKIELVYGTCELVAQMFVYGDSLKSACVGIVVPDEDSFTKFARGVLGDFERSFEEICDSQDEKVKGATLKELQAVGKKMGLKGFEQVKAIYLEKTAFAVPDLLTPTFKLKRHAAKLKYQSEIDRLYKNIS